MTSSQQLHVVGKISTAHPAINAAAVVVIIVVVACMQHWTPSTRDSIPNPTFGFAIICR